MMTLENLLKVIASDKDITINLFNENNLLLITFILKGHKCLDDFLCNDEIIRIEIKTVNTINVTIDTSKNT